MTLLQPSAANILQAEAARIEMHGPGRAFTGAVRVEDETVEVVQLIYPP
jgi:hypothetical protein